MDKNKKNKYRLLSPLQRAMIQRENILKRNKEYEESFSEEEQKQRKLNRQRSAQATKEREEELKYSSSKNDSWFDDLKDFGSTIKKSISNISLSDIPDTYRMWWEGLGKLNVDEDLMGIREQQENKDHVEMIARYKDLHNKKLEFEKLINSMNQNQLNSKDFENLLNQLNDINAQINQYDNYFLTEGKNNDIIAQQLFDFDKLSFLELSGLSYDYIMKDVKEPTWEDWKNHPVNSALTNVKNLLNVGAGILNYANTKVGEGLIAMGYNDANGKRYRYGNAIKQLSPDDPLLKKIYKGSADNLADLSKAIDSREVGTIDKDGKYIGGSWYNAYDRKQVELKETYKADKEFLKSGKIKGLDIVDFEDINPQFRKEHEEFGSSFSDIVAHPLHGLVETNSTVGMMKYQLPAYIAEGVGSAIARGIQAYVTKGNPYGRALDAAYTMYGAALAAAPTMSMYGAIQSRKSETASEAIEAFSERVMNAVNNGEINTNLVINQIVELARYAGLDVEDLITTNNQNGQTSVKPKDNQSLAELIKIGLSFNFGTSDKAFEEAKINARRGLNKLINANNALAASDYLQSLPFLSFGGSAVKSLSAKELSKDLLKTAAYEFGANTGKKSARNIVSDFINGGAYTKAQQMLKTALKPTLLGITDYATNKVVKKMMKHDVAKALKIKDASKYLTSKLELIAGEGFLEGLEEVNLNMLSSRYQRGDYDDYTKDVSMFDLNEAIENISLSMNGLGNLVGINTSDPDNADPELRKAFNIGFASSILFGGLSHAKNNLYNTRESNITSFITQLRDDSTIGKVFAEQLQSVQDLTHLGMYYDAMTKNKMSSAHIKENLRYLKDNIDKENSLVTEGFLDADMRLVDAMEGALNSPMLREIQKTKGLSKEEVKRMTMNAAKAISDSNTASELITKFNRSAVEKTDVMIKEVEKLFNQIGFINLDVIDEFREKNPKIYDTINNLLKNYREYVDNLSTKTLNESYNYDSFDQYYEEKRKELFDRYLDNYEEFSKDQEILTIARNNSQSSTRKGIERELRNLFDNEFESTIIKAHQMKSNGVSAKEFVIDKLRALPLYQKKKAAEATLKLLLNQEEKQKRIREFTGLDIDLAEIVGIHKAAQDQLDQINKQIDFILGNDAIRSRNEKKKKEGNTDLEEEYKLEDIYENGFEIDSEYNALDEYQHASLAKAIAAPMLVRKNAYTMSKKGFKNTQYNPNAFRDMLYGEESEIFNGLLLDSEVDSYNNAVEELSSSDPLEMLVSRRKQLQDVVENAGFRAARALILREIENMRNRNYIANKLRKDEAITTPNDVEDALNGDEDALRRVQEFIDNTEEGENAEKVITDALDSGERSSRDKFNHGKRKTKADKQKDIDKAKEKISKFAEASNSELVDEDEEEQTLINQESEDSEDMRELFDEVLEENKSEETPEELNEEPQKEKVEDNGLFGILDSLIARQQDESNDSDNHAEDPHEDSESYIPSENDEEVEFSENEEQEGELSQESFLEESIEEDETLKEFLLGAEDDFGGYTITEEETDDGEPIMLDESGETVDNELKKKIKGELDLLFKAQEGQLDLDDLPGGNDIQNATNDNLGGLINQTMFYDNEAEEAPYLKVDGKDVVLPKKLGTGKELSKKLSKTGWLASTKKYYVVTQSLEALNVKHNQDVRDAMTVALILEDNEACYAVFYRLLGTIKTKVEDNNTTVTYTKNAETKLRNELYVKNIDWSLLNDEVSKLGISEVESILGRSYPLKAPKSSKEQASILKPIMELKAKEIARGLFIGDPNLGNGNDKKFERWWKGLKPSDYRLNEEDEEYKAKREYRKNILEKSYNLARLSVTKIGKQPITNESIDRQIDLLRLNRNEVIDAYLDKSEDKKGKVVYSFPKEVRTDILPKNIHQSNGKLNVVKDEQTGRHIFGNPMPGLTYQLIADEIESGNVEFGFGTGAFSSTQFEIIEMFKPFGERKIMTNENGYGLGRGLSGKIYRIVKSPNGTKVPVMLRESKFNTQTIIVNGKPKVIRIDGKDAWDPKSNRNKFVECFEIDPNTQNPRLIEDSLAKPSIAEILFYMVCGKLGNQNTKFNAEYFIHNGVRTLIQNTDKFYLANDYLGPKLLYWGPIENGKPMSVEQGKEDEVPRSKYGLIIGLLNEDGIYQQAVFEHDYLFNASDEAALARRTVIRAIASQMHWSTDAFLLSEKASTEAFEESFGEFVKEALKQNQGEEECSFYGCPELTFKRSEWEEKNERSGKVSKLVQYMAWCLNNGKLATDIDMETPFRDPFVFANGVKQTTVSNANRQASAIGATDTKPASIIENKPLISTNVLWDNAEYDSLYWTDNLGKDRKVVYDRLISGAKRTEVEKKELFEALNMNLNAQKHNGYRDVVVFRLSNKTYDKPKEAVEYFKAQLKDFIDQYNKLNGTNLKYNESSISKIETLLTQQYSKRKSLPILEIFNDGSINLTIRSINEKYGFTGMYSQNRGKGKIDIDRSKAWVKEKLGLAEHLILTTEAIMRGTHDEKVFGLVNVATESIYKGLMGQGYIMLSELAGKGVEYHEAWHYVNLLINDKSTRQAIYDSYVNSHRKYRKGDYTYKDIEEALAEDFRKYILGLEDDSIVGKVKRLFNNVINFLIHTQDKKAYRQVFKAIHSGKYKGLELDKESVKEFHERYDKMNGAYSSVHVIPGVNPEDIANMKSITTQHEFFEALEGCVNYISYVLNFDSVDQIKLYNGKDFNAIIGLVEDLAGRLTDPHKQEVLTDILNNPSLIKKALQDYMLSIGVNLKVKTIKLKQEKITGEEEEIEIGKNEKEEAIEREEGKDNTWDKIDMSMSHKDNAALRAKMFLKRVPKLRRIYNRDGSPSYEEVYDKFGTPMFWEYDEVWNLIMNELWQCTTLDAKDENGEYLSTSIRGNVQRLAQSNAMFYALQSKFDEIEDDVELRSLIFTTISASKNPVMLMEISNPVDYSKLRSYEEEGYVEDENYDPTDTQDTGAVADRIKPWTLRNDSALLVSRSVPRTWSKNAALNGISNYNMKTGESTVSTTYVNQLQSMHNEIKTVIDKYKSKKQKAGEMRHTEEKLKDVLYKPNGLRQKFIEECQFLGIPIDNDVLDAYIAMHTNAGNITMLDQINIISLIYSGNNGTIAGVIENIILSKGKSAMVSKDRRLRGIDEVFDKYNSDSEIGKLAIAYNNVHPQLREYAVRDANDNLMYPINMPNELTDKTQGLMDPESKDYAGNMKKSSYCEHSIICNAALKVDKKQPGTELRLNTFAGLRDINAAKGADHGGLVAVEDLLCKMFLTEYDHIIFPTMADKKTWQSLLSSNIHLSHDLILTSPKISDEKPLAIAEYEKINPYDESKYKSRKEYETNAYNWYLSLPIESEIRKSIYQLALDNTSKRGNMSYRRFSDDTLKRFAYLFLDEINALIDYYDEKHIYGLVNDANKRLENFSGKLVNGRLDFSGNGGKFRYFYDTIIDEELGINLNLKLQQLFELLKKIESGQLNGYTLDENGEKDVNNLYTSITSLNTLGKESSDCDGFELIRDYLNDLRNSIFDRDGDFTQDLINSINDKLISMTEQSLKDLSISGDPLLLITIDQKTGNYVPLKIPKQLLQRYSKQLETNGLVESSLMYATDKSSDDTFAEIQATYSLIANHTVNTILSIMEIEKIYTGDSAAYKKKPNQSNPKSTLQLVEYKIGNQLVDTEVEVENLDDTFSDKIKRLGGTQSPGNKLRLDFSEEELSMDPTLKSTKYTVLNVEDIELPSSHLDIILSNFKTQLIVDYIRSHNVPAFEKIVDQKKKERNSENERLQNEGKKPKSNLTRERVIDLLYSDNELVNSVYEAISKEDKDGKEFIDVNLKALMKPYTGITVADALVFIRPALYRKVRISLGEWSFDPDENGYSDEIAYDICENDDEWMNDPDKASIVRKFLINALKMSYFQNSPFTSAGGMLINKPIYNKMALFPLFKLHRSTNVGRELYDRMNLEGHELDMIAFKSAVKVGAILKTITANADENSIDKLHEKLKVNEIDGKKVPICPNNQSIDYTTGDVKTNISDNTLGVSVQDLHNIRLQLNTHAHETDSRAIGTQMFKIAFSNIIDDAEYGTNKSGRKSRKGSVIKEDIIRCILRLTGIGVDEIRSRFYKGGHLNYREVENYIQTVAINNGLGEISQQLLAEGSVAAALMSRSVFEHGISSYVNQEVININTKGGTAIQQSVFGFVGHDNSEVIDDSDKFVSYNGGEELNWNAKEGSMEVMLTMNFFKSVVPTNYQTSYESMRSWLIENDIIKGIKKDGSKSDPKPFGVGYRIPTQGMSSMFSYIVADVLPEQVGDLIIVPREFTAQTGSDFDVDKLFLANFSYRRGSEESVLEKEGDDEITSGAISNTLLFDYIDIISDRRNFGDSRASIDVITNNIKKNLLPILRDLTEGYRVGMSELLPAFQAKRKMEFGVGKTGIGPFALNITNLALTQYTHLTIDFGDNPFNLGSLDEIYGQDGQRISAWLSAMVNAHVDVAKDAYVFDLNVNQFTYNHANLLLRAGKGISTFTFLAQPALKKLADMINNAGGVYGKNINGEVTTQEGQNKRKKRFENSIIYEYRKSLEDRIKRGELTGNAQRLANEVIYWSKINFPASDAEIKEVLKLKQQKDFKAPSFPFNLNDIFDFNKSAKYIKTLRKSSDSNELALAEIHQIASVVSYEVIDKYAQNLSQLVQCSQIDTKKFGNNIASLMNFENKLNTFKCKTNGFIINKPGFIDSVPIREGKKEPTSSDVSYCALKEYFSGMYLDKKFKEATKYTKRILQNQLFTATDAFNDIYRTMCGVLFGSDVIETIDGNSFLIHGQIFKDETVQAISSSLDDIIRFTAFMSNGATVLENANENALDFTNGGIDGISLNMKRLLFGNKEEDSIFKRVAKLVKDIKKDPYAKESYIDLIDEEGNLINDLLNYLNPQSANDKFPIGRMLLATSLMNVASSYKRKLMASFDVLLSSEDDEIRKLAEDLAYYAYFSTYDLNTSNSFFDLVPPDYRKQYDLSLRKALKEGRWLSGYQAITGNTANSDIDETSAKRDMVIKFVSNALDIMSRNYWYNDNIVPKVYIKSDRNTFNKIGGNVLSNAVLDPVSGRMFSPWIASTQLTGLYFKIQKGSTTMLYRKVGTVERVETKKDSKGEEKQYTTTFNVYAVVPKAGIHKGKINQFELYCNAITPSVFEQNRIISDKFALDNVIKNIKEFIADSEKAVREDQDVTFNFEWGETIKMDDPMYMSTNQDTYDKTSADNLQSSPTTEEIQVSYVTVAKSSKNANYTGSNNADHTINIVSTDKGSEVNRSGSKVLGELKSITDIGLDKPNVLKIVSDIKKLNKNNITLFITSNFGESGFIASEQEISELRNKLLDEYRDANSNNDNIEDMIKKYEETLTDKKLSQDLLQDKTYKFLSDLITSLRMEGIVVDHLSAPLSSNRRIPFAISLIHKVHNDAFEGRKAIIYPNNKYVSNRKKYNNFIDLLSEMLDDNSDSNELTAVAELMEIAMNTIVESIETKANNVVSKFAKFAAETTDEAPVSTSKFSKFASMDDISITDEAAESESEDNNNKINKEC